MKSVFLRTRLPGPKSKEILRKLERNVPSALEIHFPTVALHASGALVTDADGNRLLDFAGGVGAMNLGHGNEEVLNAIRQQADRFTHMCCIGAAYESYAEAASLMNSLTPGNFKKKTMFYNSGAEAVENAVKIARRVTGRQGIVAFDFAFHGRTLLTLSMTSKVKPYKLGFGPFAPEIYKLPYPYLYRRPDGLSEKEYVSYLLDDIENRFFKGVVAPENIAAVVFEPVAGEGGYIVPPKEYVQALAKICKENGILFVADEVQSGFCRTGKFFAMEHFGVVPDLVTSAKSIASGMPLSAVTGRADIMDKVHKMGMGTTFGGNPVSCAAAVATIKEMQRLRLWDKAEEVGNFTMKRLRQMEGKHKEIGDVRGLGAMCGMEIVKKGKVPDKERTEKITDRAFQKGLMIFSAGMYGNVLRTLMPLTIEKEQLEEGLDILEDSL